MNYEIVGKLIFKEETQHISDRFQKREFVIEVENEKNSQWNDFVKVQLIQDRCDLLENIDLNENIKVYFNIRGRKWENKGQVSYFTNLEGWRIEKVAPQNPANIPGVGTGTYGTHGNEPGWWYMDLQGEWHYSTGVSSKMPMYNAGKELKEKVVKIAREVFK